MNRQQVRESIADVLTSDRVTRQPTIGREYALGEADAVMAWLSANGYQQIEPLDTNTVERAWKAWWIERSANPADWMKAAIRAALERKE